MNPVTVPRGTTTNTATIDSNETGPDTGQDSVSVAVVAQVLGASATLVVDKAASTESITITGPAAALVATPSVVTWTLSYTLANGPVTGHPVNSGHYLAEEAPEEVLAALLDFL